MTQRQRRPLFGRAVASLDPFDLGAGVVAVDAQVPGVADDARGDPDGRVIHAHAGERGGVGLAPLLAVVQGVGVALAERSEEHTSELQSLMRISYAVFCLKKKNTLNSSNTTHRITNI